MKKFINTLKLSLGIFLIMLFNVLFNTEGTNQELVGYALFGLLFLFGGSYFIITTLITTLNSK